MKKMLKGISLIGLLLTTSAISLHAGQKEEKTVFRYVTQILNIKTKTSKESLDRLHKTSNYYQVSTTLRQNTPINKELKTIIKTIESIVAKKIEGIHTKGAYSGLPKAEKLDATKRIVHFLHNNKSGSVRLSEKYPLLSKKLRKLAAEGF